MAYDDELAERIRALLARRRDLTEKPMFGGLAFLLGGHLAVAASGRGGLMVRIDPVDCETFVRETGVERMVMSGRTMDGWVRVDAACVETDEALERWVSRGADVVRSLPPK